MNQQVSFRHTHPSAGVRQYLQQKLDRVVNTFAPRSTHTEVEISHENDENIVKIDIKAPKNLVTHVQARKANVFEAINQATSKLKKTLRRRKERIQDRHINQSPETFDSQMRTEGLETMSGTQEPGIDADELLSFERARQRRLSR
jgi:ribosomal subunit interface protein